MANELFTNFGRSLDDGYLHLWIERDGKCLDSVELDVTELSNRPDLLDRLSQDFKDRMLWEGREIAQGNRPHRNFHDHPTP